MPSASSDPITAFFAVAVLSGLYIVGLYVYRLTIDPLARFPGPWLAGMTSWYEFYYDVALGGRFAFHVADLHRQYGPIVRITPWELHIQDSDFFDCLYRHKDRQDRSAYFARRFGYSSDTFSTVPHSLHARRRRALCPMFSDRRISAFQPVIRSKLDVLCKKLRQYCVSSDQPVGKVVSIDRAWMALTTDIITDYAFMRSYDHLEAPHFSVTVDESLREIYTVGQVALHFPVVFPILSVLPDWLVLRVRPALQTVVGMRRDLARRVGEIRTSIGRAGAGECVDEKEGEPPGDDIPASIFHQLLQSDLPACEKTDARLGDEAQLIVGAGLVTTAWALSVATFHLAANPDMVARLRHEICSAMIAGGQQSDGAGLEIPDWHVLHRLPYLFGCVQEAVRLSHGVSARAPRVLPDTDLVYQDWIIPRRTTISMTAVDVLMDPTIFPRPHQFLPDRWIVDGCKKNHELEKYFVPFGRGPRQCLGINLAQAELYLAIAIVFSRFRFTLFETTETDVRMEHAYHVPYPEWSSKGVRAKVCEAPLLKLSG